MKYGDIKCHLSSYLDNELPEQIRQYVADHLKSCSSCAADLHKYQQISAAFEDMRSVELPSGFMRDFNSRLQQEKA